MRARSPDPFPASGDEVDYPPFSYQATQNTPLFPTYTVQNTPLFCKVVHSHCNGLPLQADSDPRVYKLIFMDIGLMNAVCGLDRSAIDRMSETRLVNDGAMAEQFVGQHLQDLLADSPNRELTYWLREGRSSNAEVDYVAAFDGRIVPIEVKAGASGALKSLHQFAAEKEVCPTEATIRSSSLDIAAISSADPMVTRRQSASP